MTPKSHELEPKLKMKSQMSVNLVRRYMIQPAGMERSSHMNNMVDRLMKADNTGVNMRLLMGVM